MTSMSKLVGELPWTVVSPVPTMPGWIWDAGRTSGGDAHDAAAGAGVDIAKVPMISAERQTPASPARPRRTNPLLVFMTSTPLGRANPMPIDARRGEVVPVRSGLSFVLGGQDQSRAAELDARRVDLAEGPLVADVVAQVDLEGDRSSVAALDERLEHPAEIEHPLVKRRVRVPAAACVVRQVHVGEAAPEPLDRLHRVQPRHRDVAGVQGHS